MLANTTMFKTDRYVIVQHKISRMTEILNKLRKLFTNPISFSFKYLYQISNKFFNQNIFMWFSP
jgi:hypothetical protein